MNLDNLNAPQFVDFTQLDDGLTDEDNYFDFDHEGNGVATDEMFKDANDSRYSDAKENQVEATVPQETEQLKDGKQKPTILSTVYKSMAEWRSKFKPLSASNKAADVRRSPRSKVAALFNKNTERSSLKSKLPTTTSNRERNSAKIDTVKGAHSSSSTISSLKRSRTRSVERSVQSNTGTKLTRTNSLRSIGPRRSETRQCDHRLKLTKPKTPECLKREIKHAQSTKLRSTTDMELQEVDEFKKALAQKRKHHEQFRQKAMHSGAVVPKILGKAPTRPEEFHFKTDDRVKSHGMETRQDICDGKSFTSTLRNQQQTSPRTTPQKTRVRPFSFDKKRKRPSQDGHNSSDVQYTSMAEMVKKFTSKTPDRFRRKANSKEPSPSKRRRRSISQPQLTLPKTPNLQTRVRSRPIAVKSQKQIEEEEYEEHNKQQFKAHRVNEEIFDKVVGVKKVEPRPVTHAMTPQLELRRRAAAWREHQKPQDVPTEFHAHPVPKAMFDGPTGIKPAQHIPLTVPASPAFATRNRVATIMKHNNSDIEKEEKLLRTRPIPKFGVPFKPKLETRTTEPRPFSFDERIKVGLQKKDQRIQQLTEEQNQVHAEFHANPIPDLSPELPTRVVKPPTRPKPFQLGIDVRGQAKAEEWSQKIKDELKSARDQANFKAMPSTVLQKKPFIPKKSNKPVTDVSDVQLNTEKRLEDRSQWERWRQEKEQEQCEIDQQRHAMKEQEEKEQEKLIRKQLVTKAQPIRKYREVAIKSSDKPLTQPASPQFSERPSRRSMRC